MKFKVRIINEAYKETDAEKKTRLNHNKHSVRKVYPSQYPKNKRTQEKERVKRYFPGAYPLMALGRGIYENLQEELILNPEDEQLKGLMDVMRKLGYSPEEPEEEIEEEKKKGRKKQCSKGNRFHLPGDLGKKSGQFQSGNKSGSSSIANDAKYAGKKGCVRGRARWTGSNERWVNPVCGRAAREKGEDRKCSVKESSAGPTVRVPEKVRIPATANGQIDLYKVSKALMDKKNHILKLQRIVNHLKKRKDCKRLSFAQGLNLVRNTVLSTKGKTDNEVEAKLRKQSKK